MHWSSWVEIFYVWAYKLLAVRRTAIYCSDTQFNYIWKNNDMKKLYIFVVGARTSYDLDI
jgi:hypothetical protein